jgi:hypothetical protein
MGTWRPGRSPRDEPPEIPAAVWAELARTLDELAGLEEGADVGLVIGAMRLQRRDPAAIAWCEGHRTALWRGLHGGQWAVVDEPADEAAAPGPPPPGADLPVP